MHIGGAVCGTARVAETLTAELEIARVGNTLSGRALAQLQSGQPNERLISGTDGIRTVQGSVDQGVIGRLVKLAPVFHIDAVDAKIGVKRRRRHKEIGRASCRESVCQYV